MNKTKLLITALGVMLVVSLCVCPVSAADTNNHHITLSDITNHIKNRIADWWSGWSFEKSQYDTYSGEWISDVRAHIRDIVTDRTKSFEDRAQAQAYALGWDERFDYYEKYGTADEITGKITYDVPFLDTIFGGLKYRERWFTTMDEYNQAMSIYMENYNSAVQEVPREV